MVELLRAIIGIQAPFNMVILVVLIGVSGSTIAVIAKEVRKYFSGRDELEFKRDMVAHGLSAQETERLLQATRQSLDTNESQTVACRPNGAMR